MRWALIIVAALAGVALVVVIIGWSLPTTHRARREATVHQPISLVHETITDVAAFPTWRSSVKRIELLPSTDGARRFREHSSNGAITYEMRELVAGSRIQTRILDTNLGYGGTWTYELVPTSGGTTVRITEDGIVTNPIFRAVSRFVIGHHATIDRYLEDLNARLPDH